MFELCEQKTKTVIYGAGLRESALYSFLNDRRKEIFEFVVSDDRKTSNFDEEGRKVLSLSDEKSIKEYSIISSGR